MLGHLEGSLMYSMCILRRGAAGVKFFRAHILPAICQFCQVASEELGPLSSTDVNQSSAYDVPMYIRNVWGKGDSLAAVFSQALKTMCSAIFWPRLCTGQVSAYLYLKAMSVGPPFALLEEAGAVLSLVEDAVPRKAFVVLSVISASYVLKLMGSLVSSTLSLPWEIQDRLKYLADWYDTEGFLRRCRVRCGKFDLLLSDPDLSDPVPPPHLLPWMGTCTRRYLTWLLDSNSSKAEGCSDGGSEGGLYSPNPVAIAAEAAERAFFCLIRAFSASERPPTMIHPSDLRRILVSSIWDSVLHCTSFSPVSGFTLAVSLLQALVVVEALLLSPDLSPSSSPDKETNTLLSRANSDVLEVLSHTQSLVHILLAEGNPNINATIDIGGTDIGIVMRFGRKALASVRSLVCHLESSHASGSASGSGSGSGSGSRRSAEDRVCPSSPSPRTPPHPQHPHSPMRMYDWELVQSEMLLGLPEDKWGLRPCSNFDCSQKDGPCEMMVKTLVCEGGCGARYCCQGCQEQAWRAGHQHNCEAMAALTMRRSSAINEWHGEGASQLA